MVFTDPWHTREVPPKVSICVLIPRCDYAASQDKREGILYTNCYHNMKVLRDLWDGSNLIIHVWSSRRRGRRVGEKDCNCGKDSVQTLLGSAIEEWNCESPNAAGTDPQWQRLEMWDLTSCTYKELIAACQRLHFSLERPTLTFWPAEVKGKFVLFLKLLTL